MNKGGRLRATAAAAAILAVSVAAGPGLAASQAAQQDANRTVNAGGATAAADAAAPAVKAHDNSFIIGPGDILAINVWKEENLSKTMPVLPDGTIALPLVQQVRAAGLTPLELERELTERLKSYITTPEVTVMVQEIKSQTFNVLGMVNKPGSYALGIAPTIIDAIAAAGGFKDYAKETGVYVIRQSAGGEQHLKFNYKDYIKGKNLDKNPNIKLEAHDTIVVP